MQHTVGRYLVTFDTPELVTVTPLSKYARLKHETVFTVSGELPEMPQYLRNWIRFHSRYIGYIYLLHFDTPYKHARHYMGFSSDVSARQLRHANGNGARLMEVISDAEITWTLARIWVGDRYLERRLKRQKNSPKLCPICKTQKEA